MDTTGQSVDTVMDHKTGAENKSQVKGRVIRNASDMHCDIFHFSKGEETLKTCSPVTGPLRTAEFMNAASRGNLDVIDKYLADGGDPNVHDELKRTALHRASLEGHTAVVQRLLDKGADINSKDGLGSRAIHWACRGGSLGVVKALKGRGADLNISDKRTQSQSVLVSTLQLNSTPLHVATRTGHAAVVEYLLSSGAKIDSRDREGDTALHDAVHLNRYKIVKLLLVAGADTQIKNHEGVTAVQQVKQWQSDIMETLQRLERLKEVGLLQPQNSTREK